MPMAESHPDRIACRCEGSSERNVLARWEGGSRLVPVWWPVELKEECTERFVLPGHLLAVGVEGIVDDPFGPVQFHVVPVGPGG